MTDEPVSLPRAVEVAVRTVASRTPEVPIIAAGATDPPAVRGDADYVAHAVRNLLASAIRFGGLEAPVIVRIEPGDGEVAVRVLDRRPDATPADLSMSFALVDEPTAPRRLRLGIPLFVTRRLIETMGGRVWARPRTDGGAELGSRCRPTPTPRPTETLPARDASAASAGSSSSGDETGSGCSAPRPGPGDARGAGPPPAPPPA